MGWADKMGKFTALSIEKLTKTPGRYCDGEGLWLFVGSPTQASWIFRYSIDGVQQDMGLGSLRVVPLKLARDLAQKARTLRAEGKDPKAEKDAAKIARKIEAARKITFRECVDIYLKDTAASRKNEKYAKQVSSLLLRYTDEQIGARPVHEINVDDIAKILRPIWLEKADTASKLRAQIEAVLDKAAGREYRSGENPAQLNGRLKHHLPKRARRQQKHHAALPYDDLPTFLDTLAAQSGIAALALRFTILTAARTGEVIGCRWDEIDRSKAVWTVPADRMKAGKEHRVPLSSAALSILEEAERLRTAAAPVFIFEGDKAGAPLSNMAMLALLKRMDRADITVHGFRSTFRDWAGEKAIVPREVCEMALAHSVGDSTERAYARSDLFERRRELMQAWARYCTTPEQVAEIVPLRRDAAFATA